MEMREDAGSFGGRVRGCLLGGAIGDALGGAIEFDGLARLRERYGPNGLTELPLFDGVGLITDDTQLTLFTVEALIRHTVAVAEDADASLETAVRQAFQRWLDTQTRGWDDIERSLDAAAHPRPSAPGAKEPDPGSGDSRWSVDGPLSPDESASGPGAEPGAVLDAGHATGWLRRQPWLYQLRAPGNACLSGLRHPGDAVAGFTAWGEPGPVNPDSKGCGTVMRAAPFGLVARTADAAFTLAARCSLYTHGHPTGYLAAGALAAIVHDLTRGAGLGEAVVAVIERLRHYPAHAETVAALEQATALARAGQPSAEKVETLGGGWIAEEALAIAVYCALVAPPRASLPGGPGPGSMRDALLLSVNHSGDSDSTGAICGNLLGAACGYESLPVEWLNCLEHRATIVELVDDFELSLREGAALARDPRWRLKYPG